MVAVPPRPGYYASRFGKFRANLVGAFGQSFISNAFAGCVGGLVASAIVLLSISLGSSLGWKIDLSGQRVTANEANTGDKLANAATPETPAPQAKPVKTDFSRQINVFNSEAKKTSKFKFTFQRDPEDKVAQTTKGFKITRQGVELELSAVFTQGAKVIVKSEAIAALESSKGIAVMRDAAASKEGYYNYFSKAECVEGLCIYPEIVFGEGVFGQSRCKAATREALEHCDRILASWALEKSS